MRKGALSDIASLILRVGLAFVFLYFGIDKLVNLQANAVLVSSLGITNPIYFTIFYGLAELLVGSFLLLGLFSRLVAIVASAMILIVIIMFWIKLQTFIAKDVGLLAAMILLALNGGGRIGLDKFIRFRRAWEHL
ncbi:MAG: DoxX family protein [Nanoarchaeota archaeon]|nr:DoxX family protein [Nanoarchaeota archaeon]